MEFNLQKTDTILLLVEVVMHIIAAKISNF